MPSALLLHGIGSGPSTLWRIRGHLESAGWSTLSPALLGHDGRPVAASFSLDAYAADLLGLPAPDGGWDLVVAHSLGGTIATRIAARVAGWARRLVLIDPCWSGTPARYAQLRAGELEELDRAVGEIAAANPDWDERDVLTKATALALTTREAVERTFDENGAWDIRDEAAALDVPTLLLTGDPDVFALVDAQLAAEVTAANPWVAYRTVAGAGHAPHRDRPGASLTAIDEWLATG